MARRSATSGASGGPAEVGGPPWLGTAALALSILALGTAVWLRDLDDFVDVTYFETSVSLARDGDLFLPDHDQHALETESHLTVTGHTARQHAVGRGLASWPFVWLGRVLAPAAAATVRDLPERPDPWTWNRYWMAWHNLPGLLASLLGLIVLWGTARLRAGAAGATAAALAVFLGTGLHQVLWFQQGGSEAVAFLFWSLLLGFLLALRRARAVSLPAAAAAGACFGAALLVRPQSVAWLLPVLIVGASAPAFRGKGIRRALVPSAAFLLAAALAFLPQVVTWKIWFGRFFPNPYGHLMVRESWQEIAAVWLSHPAFFSRTPIAWLGLAGLLALGRSDRPLALAGFSLIIANLAFGLAEQGLIENQFLASRHFLIASPFYLLGLAEIWRRSPPSGRAVLAGCLLILTALSLLQIDGDLPVSRAGEPGVVRAAAARTVRSLSPAWSDLPRTPLGPLLAALFLAVSLLFCLVLATFAGSGRRIGRRRITVLSVLAAALIAGYLALISVRVVRRTLAQVRSRAAAGFYADRWPTLAFDWANRADNLQTRALSYLRLGRLDAAERLVSLALAIKPQPEGDVPDLPERLLAAGTGSGREDLLWRGVCDRFRIPGAVVALRNRELDPPAAALDGDLETVAVPADHGRGAIPLEIALADGDRKPDDLLLVFVSDPPSGLAVEVSSDGAAWSAPFRAVRWPRALWVWDFHDRPVRLVRLSGLPGGTAGAIREIAGLRSPRHRPRLLRGAD